MVCSTTEPVPDSLMSTPKTREVALTCNWCQAKIQSVADFLLLSNDLRPVMRESVAVCGDSYSKCRDTIIARTKGLSVLISSMNAQLHSVTTRWHDIRDCLKEITELVISIIECCAHATLIISVQKYQCLQSQPGVIDKYTMVRANIDIELCCRRIQQSNPVIEELSPQLLVDICSEISHNLSVMTECCHRAIACTDDCNQEQYKLCVKCLTASASCLINSIKLYKASPTPTHHHRCVTFAEPLIAAAKALVTFSTEEEFTGIPGSTTSAGREAQTAILGSTMGITSSCTSFIKAIRDIAYDNTNERHRQRVPICSQSISKSIGQLAEVLVRFQMEDMSLN
ncbi:unnamed protein product [Owenia fusiformis]|uniref:Uncharacterized protein n=1 Tax=Owenia fusiformis TaxID=6347 RepID=A0A8J1Y555_OWEFU|nr:unnamed protein product [Owenia fusiformis]